VALRALMDLYLSAAWRAPFRAPAGAMVVSVAELLCPQFSAAA
jgi:hypothetical protein